MNKRKKKRKIEDEREEMKGWKYETKKKKDLTKKWNIKKDMNEKDGNVDQPVSKLSNQN